MWVVFTLTNHYRKSGFSLLELMIVLALVAGIFMSLIVSRKPEYPSLSKTIYQINEITLKAYTQSLLTGKAFQLRFFFNEQMEIESLGYASIISMENIGGEKIPPMNMHAITSKVHIQKLIINGTNELSKSGTKETYIILYPEGYSQNVIIGLHDKRNNILGNIQLNPFTVRFEFIES